MAVSLPVPIEGFSGRKKILQKALRAPDCSDQGPLARKKEKILISLAFSAYPLLAAGAQTR
jgi:hypothetical protein